MSSTKRRRASEAEVRAAASRELARVHAEVKAIATRLERHVAALREVEPRAQVIGHHPADGEPHTGARWIAGALQDYARQLREVIPSDAVREVECADDYVRQLLAEEAELFDGARVLSFDRPN